MGWTYTRRAKGISNDEFFQREVIGEGRTIVASSTIKSVYYAAVREDATGQVWGLVCLTSRRPNREFHNFGWKSMTEDMGPNAADAPAKVLDALTETDSEYAREWRTACRASLARKAERPVLADGDVIRVDNSLTFVIGRRHVEVNRFTYVARPRRKDIFRLDDGTLVRLPNWASYSYELVKA